MEAQSMGGRWTYAEFARLPSDGSARYEVIAGELAVTPAPSLRHQRIATDLVTLLNAYVRQHDLGHVFAGPTDVLFADGDYMEPDILFVRKERGDLLSDRGIEGPPDLIVEILSASTERRDRGIKLERYRLFGVGEYWIVDPDDRSIEVWRLEADARVPEVFEAGAVLRWAPGRGVPALELRIDEILSPA